MTLVSKLPSTGVSIFAVMSRLANELGAINLSQGFPDFDCAPELVEAVARMMRAGHNQYVSMLGVPELREALSMKIAALYGRTYDPATEITITSGATEGLFSTLMALVRPGDEVIVIEPAYDSYVPVITLAGGTPVFVSLRGRDFHIDWDEVRAALSPRTRAIMLNTPHNPTGTILTRADMVALKAVLSRTSAFVISDEVYEHIVFDGAVHEGLARDPDLATRAVVVSSFGKTYHTTGWKVGYCAAPAAITAEIQNLHQWVTFTVNGAVQLAYAEMVQADPMQAELAGFYQRKRDLFLSLIDTSRFRPLPCRGTFFQLLDYSAVSSEGDREMSMRLLREHGVASIPLSPFYHDAEQKTGVLRFCFAKRTETLERAAERLRRA